MKNLLALLAALASQTSTFAQTGAVPKERPRVRPPSALHGWADWERGKKIFSTVKVPPAPILNPEQELATFKTAPGYRVELVAAEPMIANPVFFEFDATGRIWVLEYRGYMRDLQGRGEADPICRLMILEDTNADGRADRSIVYLDQLVMPRSFAFVEGGVLLAEPPNLWYCQDFDGDLRCDKRTKLGTYGVAGNPQHTANGLRRGLDNWLHNADWPKRYRYRKGTLIKEDTIHRGQFGVSFDDLGRFVTCYESIPATMDYLPVDYLAKNKTLMGLFHEKRNREAFGLQLRVANNAREVYPIRPTPQITLGGLELRDDGTLRTYTIVSGTCVYRGDQFPKDAYGNLFIPEAGGHLIGRVSLTKGLTPIGKRFYPAGQELLASTDERFRPVNARTGPDGTLYIADMYKGIIEHVIFMVPWLSDQIKERNLEAGNDLGRIWRIVNEKKPVRRSSPRLDKASTRELIEALGHPNGWWRDTAQRLLVDNGPPNAVPLLKSFVRKASSPLGRMHALATLSGMEALDWETATGAVEDDHPYVRATAYRTLEPLLTAKRSEELIQKIKQRIKTDERNSLVLQQIILSLGATHPSSKPFDLLLKLYQLRSDNLGHTATLTALRGRELSFLNYLRSRDNVPRILLDDVMRLIGHLGQSGDALQIAQIDLSSLSKSQATILRQGARAYKKRCVGCHQVHGGGLTGVAPPLAGSEWVSGSPERLARIVLGGLAGPITVQNTKWNLHMPGLARLDVPDKEVADILTFIRKAWGNNAKLVPIDLITKERKTNSTRILPWVAEELGMKSTYTTITQHADKNGQFLLRSKTARILGQKLHYHPDLDIIGPWIVKSEAALWYLQVPEAGAYSVHLTFAMDDQNAGNHWVLETDICSLEGIVESTDGFHQFTEKKVGTMKLKKGSNSLLMRAADGLKGELIDLRQIRLIPIQ